ncbi:peptidylprolyl isomerase [Planococcus sp. N028]|uniref:peptidylprolyl isomerase n=1 Tax=Planococcus shixiaomingii TaxID=3058393 RepID=A0ABT8N289_9BACL|nr:peptidylprolyl isomerase [Planococcus sp. N028]MDN7242010.1 peptidylprolyl isomerase [Planococcus sp. N028]
MKKAMYIAIGAVLGAAIFLLTGSIQKEAIASVNDSDIDKEALYERMLASSGAATLDLMIADEIVKQEAEKAEIEVTPKEIDAEMKKYEEQFGGAEALQSILEKSGVTVDQLESEMETYLLIEKLIGPDVEITDEQIKAYFEENKESFAQPEQVEASHILVASKEEADEVAKKLKDGESFATLAADHSIDTATAGNGGELGSFAAGEMAAEFEKAAFAMKVDEISKPVETEFGFHIIKVTGKTEAAEANLEDSKEQIKETLFDEALNTQYATWIAEKKQSYEIDYKL